MPGGGIIPGGIPLPGGGGGIIPGIMPGGNPRKPGGSIPGGGIPGGIGGIPGGIPLPGGIIGGIPGGIPGGNGIPLNAGVGVMDGIIEEGDGAPTPRAGPESPAGACPGGGTAIPLLATRPTPCPGPPNCVPDFLVSSGGGLSSTDRETTHSPLTRVKPSDLLSSLSSLTFGVFAAEVDAVAVVLVAPPLDAVEAAAAAAAAPPVAPVLTITRLNSSASPSTKFMCLSNAMNLPTNIRPSSMVTRILQLSRCIILVAFDMGRL